MKKVIGLKTDTKGQINDIVLVWFVVDDVAVVVGDSGVTVVAIVCGQDKKE